MGADPRLVTGGLMPKTLGEELAMSALGVLGRHVWESSPELQALVSAAGFVQPADHRPREAEDDKPRRKPKCRWKSSPKDSSGAPAENVIELVKRPDGSYGPEGTP